MPPDRDAPWQSWSYWHFEDHVRQAPFPVYGLQGTPFGLVLGGLGHSGPPGETSLLHLRFQDPKAARGERAVSLDSGFFSQYTGFPFDWRTVPSTTPIFDPDGRAFERFMSLEEVKTAWITNSPVLVEHCIIAGQPLWGSMQLWAHPMLDWRFRFQSEAGPAQLRGEGRGFTKDDLFILLEQLVIINQRPDLAAQYEVEFESWQRPS